MQSFDPEYLARLSVTQNILRSARFLGEFKGRQDLYKQQIPQALETLRQAAIIQSTEASNRIEGVTAPLKRIQALVAEKTTPRNRSEQEIAGYRDVLNTIHANHADIPFTTGVVLQFHRDLYRHVAGEGGHWKMADNEISEVRPGGEKVARFRPVPAHATPEYMEHLHQRSCFFITPGTKWGATSAWSASSSSRGKATTTRSISRRRDGTRVGTICCPGLITFSAWASPRTRSWKSAPAH